MIRPERLDLANRARVVFAESPANPFVAFLGSLPGGVAAEPAGRHGLSELTARTLLGGTTKRTAAQLARAVEGLGAVLHFRNGLEALLFSGRCTRETAAEVFRVFREVVQRPAFPEAELEKARADIANDLQMESDDTRARAARELLARLYPRGHPYGRDPKGSEAAVRRLRRADVLGFHREVHGTDGMIVALSGDVDRELVEGTLAPILESVELAAGPRAPLAPPGDPEPNTRTVPMPHKSQVDLALGARGLARGDPRYYALALGNLLFGRIGLFGRLGENVRESKGLAYYSFSECVARRHGGHVQIAAGVNPANVKTALAAIREEMERLRAEPFTADELERGRNNEIGGLAVSLERNAEVVEELHEIEYHGLGLDHLERYPSIVRGVPDNDVRAAAQTFFDPESMSLVAAGPLKGAAVSW